MSEVCLKFVLMQRRAGEAGHVGRGLCMSSLKDCKSSVGRWMVCEITMPNVISRCSFTKLPCASEGYQNRHCIVIFLFGDVSYSVCQLLKP